jgi:hypothetical protein
MFARIGFVALLAPAIADAQTAPVHKHYDDSAASASVQAVQPGKPLAPRLQNLGVHTFKVKTR